MRTVSSGNGTALSETAAPRLFLPVRSSPTSLPTRFNVGAMVTNEVWVAVLRGQTCLISLATSCLHYVCALPLRPHPCHGVVGDASVVGTPGCHGSARSCPSGGRADGARHAARPVAARALPRGAAGQAAADDAREGGGEGWLRYVKFIVLFYFLFCCSLISPRRLPWSMLTAAANASRPATGSERATRSRCRRCCEATCRRGRWLRRQPSRCRPSASCSTAGC